MSTASTVIELARQMHKSEAEVMALAIEAGVRELQRDHVLGRYLRGQITRREAAEAVGIDFVDLAERQRQAVQEDLQWGGSRRGCRRRLRPADPSA